MRPPWPVHRKRRSSACSGYSSGRRATIRPTRPPFDRREEVGMDVCLMIEGQEDVTWEQWVGLALACEEHGFAALFRSDHYLSFGHPADWGTLDAWATLAALASRTSRIHLGTLVSPV